MPQYAKEFAAKCGINDLDQADLEVAEINLMVSACRFRTLLEIFDGQVSLALVAYNAGQSSNQVKQLQELKNLSTVETSSYLSKFMYLKEKTTIEATKPQAAPTPSQE
jgi:soluble lytic murein transglycosylase-like protein